MKLKLIFGVLFWFNVTQVITKFTIPLTENWTVCSSNGTFCLPAKVPGCIHRDLQLAGVVADFTRGYECLNQMWIAKTDWTYTSKFSVEDQILKKKKIILSADGLDAVGTVTLNNKFLGSFDSMFMQFTYDVTKILEKDNILVISFQSAVKLASQKFKQHPYVIPPISNVPIEHGFSHPMFIRKEQSSFGWDWGPAAASMGIYKDISLVGFDIVRICSISAVTTKTSPHLWNLDLRVSVESSQPALICFQFEINEIDERSIHCSHISNMLTLVNHSMTVKTDKVSPWWPHGMGSQKLYDIEVIAISAKRFLDTHRIRFAFRTIELIQNSIKPKGLSFYFKVNGRKLFLKGSNWIPARVCPANVTKDTEFYLLSSAKEANMNVLRVWGGGIYETDSFYDMADELGILLWQDFMFACAMYPTDKDFLALVRREVKYQVLRLISHPSIFIWAGNNENEKALRDDWYGTSKNFTLYYEDYVKLYVKTIREIVLDLDSSRPFVTSSPSNGIHSEINGWVAENPADPLYGDLHPYRYDEVAPGIYAKSS